MVSSPLAWARMEQEGKSMGHPPANNRSPMHTRMFIDQLCWHAAAMSLILGLSIDPFSWAQQVQIIEEPPQDCESLTDVKPPPYRVARKYRTGLGLLVIQASMKEKLFKRDELLALACSLERKYSQERTVGVRLFVSHKAAKDYDPTGQFTRSVPRAQILFDREKGTYGLEWRPEAAGEWKWINISIVPLSH